MTQHEKNPAALAGANGAIRDFNSTQRNVIASKPQAITLDQALHLAAYDYPVYPAHGNKVPASLHGFRDASNDPATVRKLFTAYPATLIGIATGEIAGIDVLDLDLPRHPEAVQWYEDYRHAIPPTRTHRSRSGGLHLLFQHVPGLRCSTARPVIGIDVRADGGGIIWWPASGCPILDLSLPAPWPCWLLEQIRPPARLEFVSTAANSTISDAYVQAAINHAARAVANAAQGSRNATLNREAWGLMRFVATGTIAPQEIARVMASAAMEAGLHPCEIKATLASVIRKRGIA